MQRRTTRSQAGAKGPSEGVTAARRRALLDVSNDTRSSKASASTRNGAKKPAAKLRRDSSVSAQQKIEDEVPAATRTRTLRASTVARTTASQESKADSNKKKRPTRSTSRTRRPTRSKSQAKSQPATKRGRESSKAEEPSNKKTKRASSQKKRSKPAAAAKKPRGRSRQNSSPDSDSEPLRRSSRSKPRNLCSDLLLSAGHDLVRQPMDTSQYTAGIADVDEARKDDVLAVSNYVTDIYQRLYSAETIGRPREYMDDQDEINEIMRAILVDWLVEVHMKFRLVPETLYLCVNIIDRYCATTNIERRKLQLVGVTALLVACKYEEIYPPEVRDCVYITDRAYCRQEVLDMEQDIVKKLEFRMTVPTGHNFLTRFLDITNATTLQRIAATYYMERTLQEYVFLKYRPSLVAAAAVCLALTNEELIEIGVIDGELDSGATNPGVPRVLLEYTGFETSAIKECATIICEKLDEEVMTASRRELVAVKRKYDSTKYQSISTEVVNPDVSDL